jgi:50S ribosomal subunit-associated GTPase HflX
LGQLHLAEIPRLVVLNKMDLLEPYEAQALAQRFGGVAVSAAKRRGLGDLIHAAEERLGREKPLVKTYVEEQVVEEAERRYQDYLDGKIEAIPGEEVIRRIKARR